MTIEHLGVSGTREGMTELQLNALKDLFPKLPQTLNTLHQGQCVGVDVQVGTWFYELDELHKIVSHPPIKKDLIGKCFIHESKPAKNYLARNRDIVLESNIMLIIPKENEPQEKGGTWYTYNFAKKNNKKIYIIYPDGRIVEE